MKLFDLLNNAVATLVDEEMSADAHSVSFSPNNLAGRIYFYKLSAVDFSESKK